MPRDPKAGRFSQSNTVAVRVRQPLEFISLSRSSWLSDSHKDLTLRACEFIDGQGRPLKFLPPQGRAIAYGFAAHDSSPIIWGRWPDRAGGGQDEALRQGPPPPSGHLPHMMGEEFEKIHM